MIRQIVKMIMIVIMITTIMITMITIVITMAIQAPRCGSTSAAFAAMGVKAATS